MIGIPCSLRYDAAERRDSMMAHGDFSLLTVNIALSEGHTGGGTWVQAVRYIYIYMHKYIYVNIYITYMYTYICTFLLCSHTCIYREITVPF